MAVVTREEERAWAKTVIKREEVDCYLDGAGRDFIDDQVIWDQIEAAPKDPDPVRVRELMAKGLAMETLQPEETAVLLNVSDLELLAEMRRTAGAIKKKVYDNRIVTFAPLYMSNHCVNACSYCGFRAKNEGIERRRLTMDEVAAETRALTGTFGHKRLIVVYGEHPLSDVDYIAESIDTVYNQRVDTRKGHANIRRVNVNAAPLGVDSLKKLKRVGIGTFQVFQETYHHDTYRKVHGTKCLKSDYQWRLYAMHRCQEAGVDDVGIGALFGLYDWRFEVLGLMHHTHELERRYAGVGPHTISFPVWNRRTTRRGLRREGTH